MKVLISLCSFIFVILGFSQVARAECPNLAGKYHCPQFGVDLLIEQVLVDRQTVYKILNTGEEIRVDGILYPYLKISNSHYRATCKGGELIYDIYGFSGGNSVSKITHEHQSWALVSNRLTINSVIIRTLGNFGVEEMPLVSCSKAVN